MKRLIDGVFGFFLLNIVCLYGIEINQVTTFQNGTTENWVSGSPNPTPPVVVDSGGPMGQGDSYLLIRSTGTDGAGGRLVVYNNSEWTGNYHGNNITSISMNVNNYGSTELHLRIAFRGPGGDFWSVNPVIIPAQSGWTSALFHVDEASLTGGNNLTSTLATTDHLRIFHNVNGGFTGDPISAELGIDNITAADNPLPVELVSFTAVQQNDKIRLDWITATEINNSGFEVERKSPGQNWNRIAFIKGQGSSTSINKYSYEDNLTENGDYQYRLKQVDYDGTTNYSNIIDIEYVSKIQFSLSQNFPNPFNPVTSIKYNLPVESNMTIQVYNSTGQMVQEIKKQNQSAGIHNLMFDASLLTSGVYVYQITSLGVDGMTNYKASKKMIVLK